jgi:ribosomal protein L40E
MMAMYYYTPHDSHWFVVFGLIVVGVMLVRTAKISRQHTMETDQHVCKGCGTPHPGFAQFCRQCGRRLT